MNLRVILSLAIFLLVLSVSMLLFPEMGNISSSATSGSTTLSVSLVVCEREVTVDALGAVVFSNSILNSIIPSINNFVAGQKISSCLQGKGFPSNWTEPEPTSSEVGSTKFEYLEIAVNNDTSGGNYSIYFNLSQSTLGNVSESDVRLFIFDSGWEELTTTVINGTSDPASFYGTTTHFSKFLLAEKAAEQAEESGGQPGSSSGSGGSGRGLSVLGKAIGDILGGKEQEKPKLPVHITGDFFDISVNIPKKYQELLESENLIAEIRILNIRRIGPVSVNIEYSILDKDDNIIFQEYETKTVEHEITYLKRTVLPLDIESGYYMYLVKVVYGEDQAFAGYPFKVITEKPASAILGQLKSFFSLDLFLFILILFQTLLILILIISFIKASNKKRSKRGHPRIRKTLNSPLWWLKKK